MTELVLSTSSISEYLRCHWRYALAHVYRRRGDQSIAAAVGQAVHSAAEAIGKPLPVRPAEAARRAFEAEVASVPADEASEAPGALSDALRLADVYQREVASVFHPTMTEQPFSLRAMGVVISGTLDAADERTDEVHDTKTTMFVSRFQPENHRLQATLYHWGYAALTGRQPSRFVLDVLGRAGRIPYRRFELTPDHSGTRDLIDIVRDGIMRAEFEPTGALSGQCQWCAYKRTCDYAVID